LSLREAIETVERTLTAARREAIEAEIILPTAENILGEVIRLRDDLRERTDGMDSGGALSVYEASMDNMRKWAVAETERCRIRPQALRERERTLESVLNYLRSLDVPRESDEETGT
jgi:hypothetical protein